MSALVNPAEMAARKEYSKNSLLNNVEDNRMIFKNLFCFKLCYFLMGFWKEKGLEFHNYLDSLSYYIIG